MSRACTPSNMVVWFDDPDIEMNGSAKVVTYVALMIKAWSPSWPVKSVSRVLETPSITVAQGQIRLHTYLLSNMGRTFRSYYRISSIRFRWLTKAKFHSLDSLGPSFDTCSMTMWHAACWHATLCWGIIIPDLSVFSIFRDSRLQSWNKYKPNLTVLRLPTTRINLTTRCWKYKFCHDDGHQITPSAKIETFLSG